MGDYMPESGSKFYRWSMLAYSYATLPENRVRWGVPDDAVTEELETSCREFERDYLRATDIQTRTPAAIATKNNSMKRFKTNFRKYIKGYITYNPRVTDEDRHIMELTVHDTKPTPAPVSDTAPYVKLELPSPGIIVISFGDKEGVHRGKPPGQHGAELIYAILNEKPKDWEELIHSTFSTRSPFRLSFKGTDRGKVLYFALRWDNTRGEKGPWSEILSVIIA
jgi:hypothetical protein